VLNQITPLILTLNEAPNVARTLDKLRWARRIVVVDSGSTDGTLELLRTYSQVAVFHHPFVDFAIQWNFALDQVTGVWVLSLDADYELSDSLVGELTALAPAEGVAGYDARFIYRVHDRALRGSLYPTRTVLFRKDKARYRMDGHTQRIVVDGMVQPLHGVIYHDDRKPLSRWFWSQQRYARDEAIHLLACGKARQGRADRLRLMAWPAPLAVFLYTLFVKGCFLDGWPGWFYALQRLLAETLLALEIIDRRLGSAPVKADAPGDPG